MKEQKKPSAFSVLMGYAGGHKALTYLSLLLSAACGVLALMPFVYLWRIIREIIEVAPRLFCGNEYHSQRLDGSHFLADLYVGLFWGFDVLSCLGLPCGGQYEERPVAPYRKTADWIC